MYKRGGYNTSIQEMERRVKEYEDERKGKKKYKEPTSYGYVDIDEPEKSVDRKLKRDDKEKKIKKRSELYSRGEATGSIDLDTGEVEEYYRRQKLNRGKRFDTKNENVLKFFY